jgi:hypothetical protein
MNSGLIIVEDAPVSTKQNKYLLCKGFSEALEESQLLVNFTRRYLIRHGFAVQSQADAIPYLTHNNKAFRLWDGNCISPISKKTFHIECKDFSQLVFYPGTGLPKIYVDKMLKYTLPEDLFIIFQDSSIFIEEWCRMQPYNSFFFSGKHSVKTKQEFLEEIIKKGFAVNHNGKIRLIPYGNRLSVLMDNLLHTKNPIPCSWKEFNKQPQYIWKMSCMKPINELVKEM